ncbi:FecR family protein [Methylomonas rivi]|uniref:FecR family protein n=1 Tax=Methylomonas rivi TaxID=2952226 RepID=A0ABT1UAF9_9GAMM|nr:FecR family protein [Methylomonas sp. WSC-6]MCQ8130846.1 FecR family protein [Methylomonas sp. WSC-6]
MPDTQPHSAEQQAMQWQAILSSDLLSDSQRRAFEIWLAENQEHAAAWQSINTFWTGLDELTLADISDQDNAQVLEFQPPQPNKAGPRYVKTGLAIAASLLLTLSLFYHPLGFYLADYRNSVGRQQQITLADGSGILLNTAGAVSIDFSGQQRTVTLHGGEAFFTVAVDRKRPFVVETEAGRVQALGTAFDVKLQDGHVSVTVFEHAVKITNADGQIEQKLAEGERLEFTRNRISEASPVNLQRAAAWHKQRMVFQDQPLATVVAELERYRPGKIFILSDAIKNLPITGVFDITDTDIALQSIAQSLPVDVRKIGEHLVLLSAK